MQRRYQLDATGRKFSRIDLGELKDDGIVKHIQDADVEEEGEEEEKESGPDVKPIDGLEEIAFGVPAPGASLNSAADGLTVGRLFLLLEGIIIIIRHVVYRFSLLTS